MGLYLIGEGGPALGLMAVVMTIALLGVTGLGWYVIRCDIQNRHAERDLLLPEGHGSLEAQPHGGPPAAAPMEPPVVQASAEAPTPAPTSSVHPQNRRRKGR